MNRKKKLLIFVFVLVFISFSFGAGMPKVRSLKAKVVAQPKQTFEKEGFVFAESLQYFTIASGKVEIQHSWLKQVVCQKAAENSLKCVSSGSSEPELNGEFTVSWSMETGKVIAVGSVLVTQPHLLLLAYANKIGNVAFISSEPCVSLCATE